MNVTDIAAVDRRGQRCQHPPGRRHGFDGNWFGSSRTPLVMLGLVCSVFLEYALLSAPDSLAEVVVPVAEVQTGFILS